MHVVSAFRQTQDGHNQTHESPYRVIVTYRKYRKSANSAVRRDDKVKINPRKDETEKAVVSHPMKLGCLAVIPMILL